ncbi:hypothetical protein D9X30_5879 [Cupriavidus sp. U2]|nr:hypothetical protein D9X30_5879 [Cupriavidus sp. U2]
MSFDAHMAQLAGSQSDVRNHAQSARCSAPLHVLGNAQLFELVIANLTKNGSR